MSERIPMPISQEHLNEAENKTDLLNKAITRDKLWAYGQAPNNNNGKYDGG